tara:strand:- start:525 stop:1169 length:645 start_codon:yes stop_codon:yes gene_type:complete
MKNKLKLLSMTCFLLPIITVIISYIISIKLNLVASCIPNFEGCTSISRVGRYEPVKFFFKPMMYLYSLILAYYWYNYFSKIKSIKIESKFIFWIALVSVLFLALYITFLGESEIYSFFKRIGIYIYILFIVLTQFFESKLLLKNKEKIKRLFFLKLIKIKYYLSSFLIISGIILLPILIIKIDSFPEIKNIISWNYFFLVQFYFYLVFLSIKEN